MDERYTINFLDKSKLKSIYRNNGFVVVKNAFSKDEINNCTNELIEICKKINNDNDNTDLETSLKKIFKKNSDLYIQTMRTFSKSMTLQSLFVKDEIKQILSALEISIPIQSTQPVTHITSKELLLDKKKIGIEAHQDWPSIQGSLDSLIVWVPFTKIDQDHYPIQILPCSHLKGLRRSTIKEDGSIIALTKKENNNILDVVCEQGDVVIFSTFTIHRTKFYDDEKNGKFRFSVSSRFDNAIEETFINRKFPCAYKRTVERKISKPIPQSIIKKFFKDRIK